MHNLRVSSAIVQLTDAQWASCAVNQPRVDRKSQKSQEKFSWRPADPDRTGAEGDAIQIGCNGAKESIEVILEAVPTAILHKARLSGSTDSIVEQPGVSDQSQPLAV
jgi:hypothetical protein